MLTAVKSERLDVLSEVVDELYLKIRPGVKRQ